MIKIKRQRVNPYCVIDYIYKNGSLIGTQGNLMSNNKFNSKSYLYGRQILEGVKWEHIRN